MEVNICVLFNEYRIILKKQQQKFIQNSYD